MDTVNLTAQIPANKMQTDQSTYYESAWEQNVDLKTQEVEPINFMDYYEEVYKDIVFEL